MPSEPAAPPHADRDDADRLKRGQRQFMIGVALVMGGMIFGGGLAMVFYFLGQRTGAIACAMLGALCVISGIGLQTIAAKLLRSKP